MVKWLNILHFYQPPLQDRDIVQKVTEDCYLPVTEILAGHPYAHCVININGCLLEMLDENISGGKKVIHNLASMYSRGQIEITGTGKYHPIFPLISEKEAERQLTLQELSLQSYLGITEKPSILFLPELAYLPEQSQFFKPKGYSWLIIDETSLKEGTLLMGNYILEDKEQGCRLLIRDREISEALSNSIWRKSDIQVPADLIELSMGRQNNGGFLITATDVEVFGHHHKYRWKLLDDLYNNQSIHSLLPSELAEQYDTVYAVTVPSSWSTNKSDIKNKVFYPLWFHPGNKLHRMLWLLLDMTLEETRSRSNRYHNELADSLLSSCPFFWASCRPWWNGIIVEKTADRMVGLLSKIRDCSKKKLDIAQSLRNEIYAEIQFLNASGRAWKLQDDFLKEQGLNRKDIKSTLL